MKTNNTFERIVSTCICSSCSELLFDSFPLPCGNVVCSRCYRLAVSAAAKESAKGKVKSQCWNGGGGGGGGESSGRSCSEIAGLTRSSVGGAMELQKEHVRRISQTSSAPSHSDSGFVSSTSSTISTMSESGLLMSAQTQNENDAWLAVSAYTCPSKECKLIHRCRGESSHTFANNILRKLFPVMQDALALVREGEKRLLDLRSTEQQREKETSGSSSVTDAAVVNEAVLSSILLEYLNPSAEKAPALQLVYVIRCKVLAQMGLFKEAFCDASKAQELNPGNKRGLCCEKMVSWMQQMRDNCPFSSKKVCSNIKEARLQLRAACHGLIAQLSYCQSWNAVAEALNQSLSSLTIEDLGCHLCLDPLGDPVTTPCGHTFCRNCLISSLVHSKHCPLCRDPLPSIGFFVNKPADKFITSLLTNVFDRPCSGISFCPIFSPQWIPIYHGPLVYPSTTTSLHISETQYRVLIKRAIETNGTFGVMLPPCTQSNIVVNHGTMVKITNFEPLLSCDIVSTIDGNLPRYVVQVVGLHRFKIDETRLTDANYYEAQSVRVEDFEIDEGPWDPKALEHLVSMSRSYVKKLFASIPPTARLHFEAKHGALPLDPSDLSYWLAEFLPLNPYTLYQILPLVRVSERLQMLCNWMEVASNNHLQKG